jgi:heavy metal efflux system protein
VVWGFSQPIADNMEEAVSGVKGQLATKIYGDDLHVLEDKAEQIVKSCVGQGNHGPGNFPGYRPAQRQLRSGSRAAARYQINVADVQDAINTAAGGNALTQVLQGEARYDLVMRYLPQFRNTKEAIENIRCWRPRASGFRSGSSAKSKSGTKARKSTAKATSGMSRSSTASAAATWAAPSKRPSRR